MNNDPLTADIIPAIKELQELCYGESVRLGWHTNLQTGEAMSLEDSNERFPMRIALCHSELSEALEGHRKDLMDDHLPHRKMAEVELADAVIRVFDLGGNMGYDLAGAIYEKLCYNRHRQDHKIETRKLGGPGKKAY